MTLTIKGVEYTVRWVQSNPLSRHGGWTVVADEERSYFVKVNQEGMPSVCSCPAFKYCHKVPSTCKHLAALKEYLASVLEQ